LAKYRFQPGGICLKKLILIKQALLKRFAFVFVCVLPLFGLSQEPYWQQTVDYRINVALNDAENTLDAFETINYTNNSPDTLHFIWFHLWPNAYKNDRTAFSEQMLQNGRTAFYFSNRSDRGYINHLDFRVNGIEAAMQDHPLFIDVVKIILPAPVAPGGKIQITTPFHEQLPLNFSRGGHVGHSYQVTQWYPKPAVYDSHGWHEMPYLDQGEFYSELGSFAVTITVPKNYVVAATGDLQNQTEREWLLSRASTPAAAPETAKPGVKPANKMKRPLPKKNIKGKSAQPLRQVPAAAFAPGDTATKTLVFVQDRVHDFAWFADKRFIVAHDTVTLASGKSVDCFAFFLPGKNPAWSKSIRYMKDALHFRSSLIGEYPFDVVTAVEAKTPSEGGMEYPTITLISEGMGPRELDFTIEHELGHNWFYGVLATNERQFPWMDEGINTYYDLRYSAWKYHDNSGATHIKQGVIGNKLPENLDVLFTKVLEKEKLDQPISTNSADFNAINYNLIAYTKTALWMEKLETDLGRQVFDSAMREYYLRWQFRHPYPEDFRKVMEDVSGRSLTDEFALLDKKGPLVPFNTHKKIKPSILVNLNHTDQFSYINFSPAFGTNLYDKFMVGVMIKDFNLPSPNFRFTLIPLYATGSKQFNGIGSLGYTWWTDGVFQNIHLATGLSRFSSLSGEDSSGNTIFGGFYKISPSIRFTLKNNDPRSSLEKWVEFKTFLIGEKGFNYVLKKADSNYYPVTQTYAFRYLNQLTFDIEDYRVLYPYHVQLQLQQTSQFYRLNFTTNYFFNYASGGGMSARFFAAKFGFLGSQTPFSQFETERFQPKLTATRGDEDYTYENYFIGRNESTGFASQQIMMKDGGLKLRTDLFTDLQGRSDNWVSSINLNTTLPPSLVPKQLPLRIFFDVGSYADAWGSNPPTAKFLYVAGLQLSLLDNLINIYAPLLYSSDFRNDLKSVPEENTFWKKISFSIDIQNFRSRKITGNLPL